MTRKTQSSRDNRDLLDTDERKAIEDIAKDAADDAARDIFDRTPGVSMSECKLNALEAVSEYHEKHCPAKGLGEDVSSMQKTIEGINVAVVKIETKMNTAVAVLLAVAAAGFSVAVAIAGAGWAVYKQANPAPKSAHSEIIKNDGQPAPSYYVITN